MEIEFKFHKSHKIKINDNMFSVNNGPWITLDTKIDTNELNNILKTIDEIERQLQSNIRQLLGLDYF